MLEFPTFKISICNNINLIFIDFVKNLIYEFINVFFVFKITDNIILIKIIILIFKNFIKLYK